MIEATDGRFLLSTNQTSMLLRVTAHGHMELIHYGARVTAQDADALSLKRSAPYGCATNYAPDDPTYSLDALPLAWSGVGRGDYRDSPLSWRTSVGGASDFRFVKYEIAEGIVPTAALPQARGGDETLILTLADDAADAELTLYFTVFSDADVITRRTALTNTGGE